MCATSAPQPQPANAGEGSGEEPTGVDHCIVLYIQEFYRVQVFWPMMKNRRERAERVRDCLQGLERFEVVASQVKGITEVYST